MSKSKEEILCGTVQTALKDIDDYAKDEAIKFANFIGNYPFFNINKNIWQSVGDKRRTTEQLYSIFKNRT